MMGLPAEDRLFEETGVLVIGDAAHTVNADCRLITQEKGGDYLFFLKGNQPIALAKTQQLLSGAFPPQAQSIDEGHGVIVERNLWDMEVDAKTLGIPGAVQIFRIDREVQTMRRGKKSLQSTEGGSVRGVRYGAQNSSQGSLCNVRYPIIIILIVQGQRS